MLSFVLHKREREISAMKWSEVKEREEEGERGGGEREECDRIQWKSERKRERKGGR
jgi:hypothetical protein